MLTSFGSGEIWKGSNQEISVMLFPRCYQRKGEITDVSLSFYTTVGGSAITFSGSSVTVSGNSATVVFQPAQLDALDDGLLRYQVSLNDEGEPKVFNLETRFVIKTPLDYTPAVLPAPIYLIANSGGNPDMVALYGWLKEKFDSGESDKIHERFMVKVRNDYGQDVWMEVRLIGCESSASGRIEFALIYTRYTGQVLITKKYWLHPNGEFGEIYTNFDRVWNREEIQDKLIPGDGIEISGNTISCTYSGGSTQEVQQMIDDAIAAETARTEQTYLKEHQSLEGYATENWVNEQGFLKEHQSLADYYTSGQTDSAITTAVQDKVSSTTITQIWTGSQAQYDAMSAHTNNVLYFING